MCATKLVGQKSNKLLELGLGKLFAYIDISCNLFSKVCLYKHLIYMHKNIQTYKDNFFSSLVIAGSLKDSPTFIYFLKLLSDIKGTIEQFSRVHLHTLFSGKKPNMSFAKLSLN